MPEIVSRIVFELMANAKKLDDTTATRYAKRAINQVLIYCNRDDMPRQLEDVAVLIAEDMLKADGHVNAGKEVSAISRGDTSITYKDSASQTQSFTKDYERQLNHFRKLKLPMIGGA